MIILGIESSCDESAAAVLDYAGAGKSKVLAHALRSQEDEHAPFGGVVPELAARAHLAHLDRLIAHAMQEAGIGWRDLNAVAATAGPGLIGGVMTGLLTGKMIALAHKIPFCPINHLEAHALSPRLISAEIHYPYLLLLVSGGHSLLASISGAGKARVWGQSRDDAAGEVFDKTARLLGLGFPGGAALERLADEGNPQRFSLPLPMRGAEHCDLSFAGLKSAVRREAETLPQGKAGACARADLAASFQAAMAASLAERSAKAMQHHRQSLEKEARPYFVVAGGVAANRTIRETLARAAQAQGFRFTAPPHWLCTDNAAMVAYAGGERLAAGLEGRLDAPARARWPLGQ